MVCSGCPTCLGCSFGDAKGVPTCTSLTQAGVEHASSDGGTTTVKQLHIDKGYWRATSTSTNVKECFNTEACTGGMTGSSDFCLQGYEGPCERGLSVLHDLVHFETILNRIPSVKALHLKATLGKNSERIKSSCHELQECWDRSILDTLTVLRESPESIDSVISIDSSQYTGLEVGELWREYRELQCENRFSRFSMLSEPPEFSRR